jgi:thymidylate synthase (FAD)
MGMKLWTHPEITLLASSKMAENAEGWDGKNWLESDEADGDKLVEQAGRACYWSYEKGRKTNYDYLDNIIRSGHGSVLEHACWTFGIKGVSRSLTHELVRHRHLSFSQLSQRYVVGADEYVLPPGLPLEALSDFTSACRASTEAYNRLIEQLPDTKAGREIARAVLPNATATRIVVTANTRALRSLLALRGGLGADAEFRRLACQWLEAMKLLAPNSFWDMSVLNGRVVTENPKV